MFIEPRAARAPVANKSESPGRNGVITKPVSAKIMRNKMTYVKVPYVETMFTRCSSRCKMKSTKKWITDISMYANTVFAGRTA